MGSVVISGATSGAVTLAVPAEAGTRTLTLPAETGTAVVKNGDGDVTLAGTLTASTGATIFNHLDGTAYSDGGARALNTNYTNSSAFDKVIYVAVSNSSASALMLTVLDGDTIYGSSDPTAGAYYSATYIWPAGKVININMNGTPTLQRWVEYA